MTEIDISMFFYSSIFIYLPYYTLPLKWILIIWNC